MTKEIEIPLVKATNENLKGYGYLIDSFENSDIEIVTWPKQGWRDIEEGTGNEGELPKVLLIPGGKVTCFMGKIMLFNIRAIMK